MFVAKCSHCQRVLWGLQAARWGENPHDATPTPWQPTTGFSPLRGEAIPSEFGVEISRFSDKSPQYEIKIDRLVHLYSMIYCLIMAHKKASVQHTTTWSSDADRDTLISFLNTLEWTTVSSCIICRLPEPRLLFVHLWTSPFKITDLLTVANSYILLYKPRMTNGETKISLLCFWLSFKNLYITNSFKTTSPNKIAFRLFESCIKPIYQTSRNSNNSRSIDGTWPDLPTPCLAPGNLVYDVIIICDHMWWKLPFP